jgi:hypothetical protein
MGSASSTWWVRTAAKVQSLLITNESGVTTAITISCPQ